MHYICNHRLSRVRSDQTAFAKALCDQLWKIVKARPIAAHVPDPVEVYVNIQPKSALRSDTVAKIVHAAEQIKPLTTEEGIGLVNVLLGRGVPLE